MATKICADAGIIKIKEFELGAAKVQQGLSIDVN